MSLLLEAAKSFAKYAHAGEVDKAGVDYYAGHLTTVASMVETEEEKVVAFLHDVVEDTDATLFDLFSYFVPSFGYEIAHVIADAVDAMTKRAEENYDNYLSRVKENPIATVVKLADLEHNSDLGRLSVVSDKDLARVEKYNAAKSYLA